MNNTIAVIGSSSVELICQVDHLPQANETVENCVYQKFTGGKGALQAVSAARLGGEVSLLTCLGTDTFSKELIQIFQRENIDINYLTEEKALSTGTTFIFEDKTGRKSWVAAPGANHQLLPEKIDAARFMISRAEFMLLQLELPRPTIDYMFELSHSLGKKIILNPAPAQPLPDSVLKNLYFIVANPDQVAQLCGGPVETKEEMQSTAQILVQKGLKNLVILSDRFGMYYTSRRINQYLETDVLKSLNQPGLDDIFCGALAAALGRGLHEWEAVKFAISAISYAVAHSDIRLSAPTLAAIQTLMPQTKW